MSNEEKVGVMTLPLILMGAPKKEDLAGVMDLLVIQGAIADPGTMEPLRPKESLDDSIKMSYSGEHALQESLEHLVSLINEGDQVILFSAGASLTEAYNKGDKDRFYQLFEDLVSDPINKRFSIVSATVNKLIQFVSSYKDDLASNKVSLVLYDSVETIGFSTALPNEFVKNGEVVVSQDTLLAHKKKIQEKYFFVGED